METAAGSPVIEAQCMRMSLLRPVLFRIICSATGEEKEISVSHTVTLRQGGDEYSLFEGTVAKSTFKINGTDVWEILRQNGLSLEKNHEGLRLNFNVNRNGERVIRLEPAPSGPLPIPGNFRVICEREDIENAFLICFIVSRVEFY